MNTLHKKWKLCGNRQKIFFSKVSGGCKRKTFVRLLLRVLGFQPAGTSCREERMAAVMDS